MSEPRCTGCSRRTAPWSGRVSLLNREFPRTVPARSSPPPWPRSEAKFHMITLPNISFKTQKRSNWNRSGACPIGSSRALPGRHGAVAIGTAFDRGDRWNQIASRVFHKIPAGEQNMWVALSSIVLASAIGLNVLALWLVGSRRTAWELHCHRNCPASASEKLWATFCVARVSQFDRGLARSLSV
jgi:hypothetical protein